MLYHDYLHTISWYMHVPFCALPSTAMRIVFFCHYFCTAWGLDLLYAWAVWDPRARQLLLRASFFCLFLHHYQIGYSSHSMQNLVWNGLVNALSRIRSSNHPVRSSNQVFQSVRSNHQTNRKMKTCNRSVLLNQVFETFDAFLQTRHPIRPCNHIISSDQLLHITWSNN